MTTLVEYLAPVSRGSRRDQVLGAMYFRHRADKKDSLTIAQIRDALRDGRISGHRNLRIDGALAGAGALVHSPGFFGRRRLWQLTETGKKHVRDLLGEPVAAPATLHDISALSATASKIADEHVKSYVRESLACLQAGAMRATVVFLWSGAIRLIETECLGKRKTTLNAAIRKFYPKAKTVGRIDDFAYIKDTITLKTAQELGIFDKSEWETLDDALKLRNRCGHPAKYSIGEKKVSSYIEDLLSIVFK